MTTLLDNSLFLLFKRTILIWTLEICCNLQNLAPIFHICSKLNASEKSEYQYQGSCKNSNSFCRFIYFPMEIKMLARHLHIQNILSLAKIYCPLSLPLSFLFQLYIPLSSTVLPIIVVIPKYLLQENKRCELYGIFSSP